MDRIFSIKDLEDRLINNGVDISQWGSYGRKSVANLWSEIINGETQIQTKPFARTVDVVQVIIRDNNRILVELEQEFGNGERRMRNRLPSEKMKTNETYRQAALRCLKEELGVNKHDVTFTSYVYAQSHKVMESPSYPGLPTRYTFHTIEVRVHGLPFSDFWRENAAYEFGDPVKRHHWIWIKDFNIQD